MRSDRVLEDDGDLFDGPLPPVTADYDAVLETQREPAPVAPPTAAPGRIGRQTVSSPSIAGPLRREGAAQAPNTRGRLRTTPTTAGKNDRGSRKVAVPLVAAVVAASSTMLAGQVLGGGRPAAARAVAEPNAPATQPAPPPGKRPVVAAGPERQRRSATPARADGTGVMARRSRQRRASTPTAVVQKPRIVRAPSPVARFAVAATVVAPRPAPARPVGPVVMRPRTSTDGEWGGSAAQREFGQR